MPSRVYYLSLLLVVFAATSPRCVRAQLISPGKLASAHQAYEGVSNCTSCHTLGQRGVDPARCLTCHTTLATRINRRVGYHGRLDERDCGTCHKDHYGRDFAIVRFDTTSFDHAETGYRLAGSHADASCRTCHRSSLIADREVVRFSGSAGALSKTYLGLSTSCDGCHETDSPHGEQFSAAACADCHGESGWKPAQGFAHDRTRYPLTGRHANVACSSCHKGGSATIPVEYRGLQFGECSACHADVHVGRMGSACSNCHATAGWALRSSSNFEATFDHDRTEFQLTGIHETAACVACHRPGATASATVQMTYPRSQATRTYAVPSHETCGSCHADVHAGGLPHRGTTGVCTDCHDQNAWGAPRFDWVRHATETRFPLEGAHVAVPCSACHIRTADAGISVFGREDRSCTGCHTEDDPHRAQFETDGNLLACAGCHSVEEWTVTEFDHGPTRFKLDGRHVSVPCAACHKTEVEGEPIRWRGLGVACVSCHVDRHAGQFDDRTCETCHDTKSFRLESFDHQRTRFPLDGAHSGVPCGSCHPSQLQEDGRSVVRFRPLDTQCVACHPS